MPRLSEAMKDVISCEKHREAQISLDPVISEWDNPPRMRGIPCTSRGGERGELKHLSTRRKRK